MEAISGETKAQRDLRGLLQVTQFVARNLGEEKLPFTALTDGLSYLPFE